MEQDVCCAVNKTEYSWLQTPELLRNIAEKAEAVSAGLWYLHADGRLHLCALWGRQDLSGSSFAPGEGLCGTAFAENAVYSADLVEDDASVLALDPGARAAAAMPVAEGENVLGALHVSANRVSGLADRMKAAMQPYLADLTRILGDYTGKNIPERPVFAALRDVTVTERDGSELRTVLSEVNLTLREGELLCVLGGRCSGKTTLCSVATGLDVPDVGTYTRENKDFFRLSEAKRRKFRLEEVGYVSAEAGFLQDLTVGENLQLLSRGNREKVQDALCFAGLQEHSRTFPDRLSAFERRRAELAGARMKAESLLVADEPEAELGSSRDAITALLKFCADEGKRAVLFATSAENTAAAAHRVVKLEDGAVCSMAVNPLTEGEAKP